MAQRANMACRHCGKQYAVTSQYLAQYGGQEVPCSNCEQTMLLPASIEQLIPGASQARGDLLHAEVLMACPYCGYQYTLTGQYIQQWGGQAIECEGCHLQIGVPASIGQVAHRVQEVEGDDQVSQHLLSYATPGVNATPTTLVHFWREGDLLVMQKDASLPQGQCIVCGRPCEEGSLRVKLRWSEKIRVRTPLGGRAILAEAALEFVGARTVKVDLPLCNFHRPVGLLLTLVLVLCEIVGITGYIYGSLNDFPKPLVYAGAGLIFAPLIYLTIKALLGFPIPTYIDHRIVKLRKVHPNYLNQIPIKQMVPVKPPDELSNKFDKIR